MAETFDIESVQNLGEGQVRFAVRVPLGCVHFDGHFEGRPMLPGVAQVLGLGHELAVKTFPGLGAPRRLLRTKFLAVVAPGDLLDLFLDLSRDGDEARVRFRLERGKESVSSGTLVYAAV